MIFIAFGLSLAISSCQLNHIFVYIHVSQNLNPINYHNGTIEQIVATEVMSMMVKLSAQIHVGSSAK